MGKNTAKLLKSVKDQANLYSAEEVDCFEKPQSIAIGTLGKEYAALYIILMKLTKSYYLQVDVTSPEFDHFLADYLEKHFGIAVVNVKVNGDLCGTIKSIIDLHYPAAVPINLKALYYSEHYMVNNWSHLVIIKGYDERRQIFHMLDAIQNDVKDGLAHYTDFPIRYSDMEECFRTYSYFSDRDTITYYKKVKDISKKDILQLLLREWADAIQNRAFMQKRLFEYVLSFVKEAFEQDENAKISQIAAQNEQMQLSLWAIVNLMKYKSVMFHELISVLEDCEESQQYIVKLRKIEADMAEAWSQYTNRIVMNFYKKDFSFLEKEMDIRVIDAEDALKNELYEIIDFLKKSRVEPEKDTLIQNRYLCENNEDFIIKEKGKNIMFLFENGKIYNSWVEDECPKVILTDDDCIPQKVTATLQITEECSKVGFQAGLFIRDANDDLYGWGLNDKNHFNCDFGGKRNIDFTENKNQLHDKATLFLEIENKTVKYGTCDKDGRHYAGKFEMEAEPMQTGLMCKTWDECRKLKVEFTDFEVKAVGEGNV